MNSHWLTIALRIIGAIFLAIGAVKFLSTLSFHTEEEITPTGVSIDHMVGFGHISLVPFLIGVALIACSFMISRKRV
ncbi:MAG TPA: hypothetical protein VJU77_15325 [Chthoniobacterales bacterium]|nr:hypothetical protein [Chthoniobacterales bacterium]